MVAIQNIVCQYNYFPESGEEIVQVIDAYYLNTPVFSVMRFSRFSGGDYDTFKDLVAKGYYSKLAFENVHHIELEYDGGFGEADKVVIKLQ